MKIKSWSTYKANRAFDGDLQKKREPIKDMEKFKKYQEEFLGFYFGALEDAKLGKIDNTKLESALIIADKFIQLEPQRAIPWTFRSMALSGLGRFDEALEANAQSIEIDPSDPDKWRGKASLLRLLNRIDEAKDAENMAKKLSSSQS